MQEATKLAAMPAKKTTMQVAVPTMQQPFH